MKTLRMHAAVLMAIKQHADAGEPFSAHNITEYIRSKINDGEWELISGQTNIHHKTVRGYIDELMEHDLLELEDGNFTFVVNYKTDTLGSKYKEYSVQFEDESDDFCDPEFDCLSGCSAHELSDDDIKSFVSEGEFGSTPQTPQLTTIHVGKVKVTIEQ